MNTYSKSCPLESMVERALAETSIRFKRDDHGSGLDFYLLDDGVYIELKRFHTPRVADQLARRSDVILLQGVGAVKLFCVMLRRFGKVPHEI